MANASNTPDKWDLMYQGFMQAHEHQINMMAGLVVPKTPIDPGAFFDESSSVSDATETFINKQVDRPALINSIMVYLSAPGTLTIGDRIIPMGSGLTTISNIDMVVLPQHKVTLECPTSGAMFIELMGRVISGTNWSVV